MFGNKKQIEDLKKDHKEDIDSYKDTLKNKDREIKDIKHQAELDAAKVQNEHEIALKDKEFEIKHLADARVKTAEDKATKLEQDLAVANKEIQMLVKITDLNADVIDVKKLVSDLINKLPEIKLTSLAGSAPAKGGGEKKE